MKFKFLGTEIYVSFLFTATIAFLLATDRTGLFLPTFFAALIHEAGHLLCLWACDCQPKAIRLLPTAVQIVNGFTKSIRHDAAISLCGPCANIVVFFALYVNYIFTNSLWVLNFSLLNLILAVFNLLPVWGLDGGTLLTLALSRFLCLDRAERTVRIITILFSAVCFIVGVYLWVSGRLNISAFIVALYLLLSALLKH